MGRIKKPNLEDLVFFRMRKNGFLLGTFVAIVLGNPPVVTFNTIHVSTLMARMKTATVVIAGQKSTVYCDLRIMLSIQAKAHDNPLKTVSVMTTTYHAA